MMDNFSDAPMTIGEIRSTKTDSMRDISPREILIEILREIDSGRLTLADLVIVGIKNGKNELTYRASSPRGGTYALGMLTRAIHIMQQE